MKKLALTALSLAVLSATAQADSQLFTPSLKTLDDVQQLQAVHVQEQQLMTINQGALKATTDRLFIQLTPELNIAFDKSDVSESASGSMIWQGVVNSRHSLSAEQLQDPVQRQKNTAILVQRQGKVTGTIRYQGQLYKIRPALDGEHIVSAINESLLKDHADEYVDPVSRDVTASAVATQSNAPVINLLVAYTSKAASLSGDINALIDLAVTETNNGYNTSGVNASVAVVHKYQVSYSEASNSETDLNRLSGTSDGYMDEIHALRDQHGADIVLLVNDVNGYCGQADAIYANAASAFAIVDYDCATGYYSFGHELGHLQGARHNPENDPTTTPFAYGHGYQHPASAWRTVMAYNCSPSCTRQLFWSNPNRSHNGAVTGTTAYNDNTRVLNTTATEMAAFRGDGSGGGNSNSGSESNLAASQGNWFRTSIEVPAGVSQLQVTTSGGSGDGDLYLRSGSQPATKSYTCRSWEYGNTEVCTISSPAAGTWHIGIHAYESYSGVNMSWSYQ